MRFFRRKKRNEDNEVDNTAINAMVEQLRRQIDSQEAQIITFKEDIAPQMADTIQALKMEIERLEQKVKEKDEEIANQNLIIKRISSGSAKFQRDGAGELLIQAQVEAKKYKEQAFQQSKIIVDMQKQIDLLPIICTRLVDEINKRNKTIRAKFNEFSPKPYGKIEISL